MTGTREFGVSLPLGALPVGTRVDRAAWPLHVTLVGNFRLPEDRLDLLLDTVRGWARDSTALTGCVRGEAMFGPGRTVHVDLVHGADLDEAHRGLAAALRGIGADPLVPEHWFGGHRPHVSRTPAGRANPGTLQLPTAAVVEMAPGGDPGAAVIVGAFDLGARPTGAVDAERAARLWAAFAGAGVRTWVIGGWGVDALLGEATREHHDLDLLADAADLPRIEGALAAARLTVRTVWSENRWVEREGRTSPSAFVADGPDGEVDVHVVDLIDGRPVPLSAGTVELPVGALDGRGRIGRTEVACATVEAQLVMHTGYEVPARQREDLRRLRALTG